MGIVTYCPNGHRMKVKDELAGKKGLCPDCGVKFRIPLKDAPAVVVAAPQGTAQVAAVLPVAHFVAIDPVSLAGLPRARSLEISQTPENVTSKEARESVPVNHDIELEEPSERQFHPTIFQNVQLAWSITFPGGDPSDPLPAEQLQDWLEEGQATGDELVWRTDWPEWIPVRQVFPEHCPNPSGGQFDSLL